MGKVIRLSDRNEQYIEDLRELFAKVKFIPGNDFDDNFILKIALTNTILDFKQEINKVQ